MPTVHTVSVKLAYNKYLKGKTKSVFYYHQRYLLLGMNMPCTQGQNEEYLGVVLNQVLLPSKFHFTDMVIWKTQYIARKLNVLVLDPICCVDDVAPSEVLQEVTSSSVRYAIW